MLTYKDVSVISPVTGASRVRPSAVAATCHGRESCGLLPANKRGTVGHEGSPVQRDVKVLQQGALAQGLLVGLPTPSLKLT